jgi:hypothetical protein
MTKRRPPPHHPKAIAVKIAGKRDSSGLRAFREPRQRDKSRPKNVPEAPPVRKAGQNRHGLQVPARASWLQTQLVRPAEESAHIPKRPLPTELGLRSSEWARICEAYDGGIAEE